MSDTTHAILGYEHYHQMLADPIRMKAFRDAIFAIVKPGDIVVDLGAGTGVLSLWAVQAGAKKVYAIEKTEAIHLAKEIAEANGFTDKIEFINKNSMDVTLPVRADVLISETLGSFAIDENTLQFTFDARDRFLKTDGSMIPQSLELFVAAFKDSDIYAKLDFWKNISGLNFSPAFDLFSKKIMIEHVAAEKLLTSPVSLSSIDLRSCSDDSFQQHAYIAVNKPGVMHGVAGWFTAALTDNINISTAPQAPLTHWKQSVFPFPDPVNVSDGDVLDWTMSLSGQKNQSDNTQITYHYRCSQIARESDPNAAALTIKNSPCPCGSGTNFALCCLR